MIDLLLKNGLICDGSGATPYIGDVAVKDGKILAVAPQIAGEAQTRLDVTGLVVSPAFIDMHAHSDGSYLMDDRCQAKIYQGVATEVVGQCGSSLFPRTPEELARLQEEADLVDGGTYQSASFEALRQRAVSEGKKMSTNLIQLVGHNAIRRGVVGLAGRASTPEENRRSAQILDENLKQGAWGLSLGLWYMPGIFADLSELVELGKVCAKHGVIITSHMRDEADKVFEAVDEMIEINRRTGAKIHIAHLKISSKKMWGQAQRLYEHISKARDAGVDITADMYPYNASSTGITNVLPEWAMEGGVEGAARRITNPGPDREKIIAWLNDRYPTKADGQRVYVVSTYGRYPQADDKDMAQLSEELGLSVPDTLLKVLAETGCVGDGIFYSMHEDDVFYLLSRDLAIGSDGSGKPYDPAKSSGKPHPRSFGTFPRFLRLRRERGLCSLETAIHRITKKPADIVGLKDRGLLAPGLTADITVFDETSVTDTATFQNPFQKPEGITHVIMNGQFAIRDGEQTQNRLGRYLPRGE